MQRRPDTFIVGAARSGTTSLYEYLKGHPEVYMSPAKEPRYFAADLPSTSAQDLRYPVDEQRYLALFRDAHDEKRLGEASVRYLHSKVAPRLIREFQSDAYIVAILRDPIDMLYATHQQRLAYGSETIADFGRALAADERSSDARHGEHLPYRQRALFGEHLTRWTETFGERVHIMVFEEFVRQPASHIRRLLDFLDVDPDWQPESFTAHNTSHAPRFRSVRKLVGARPTQWLLWRAMPTLVGERATRAVARTFRNSPLNRRGVARPPLSAELRRQLQDEFADDVARLGKLVGRDMAALWWGSEQEGAPAIAE
jgi:hypothetical protein